MPQFQDDLFLGNAITGLPLQSSGGFPGNPGGRGIGPLGRIYNYDIVPLTLQTAGLAAAQAVAGAGNLTLVAGTGVTTTTLADGTTAYVLDVSRCPSVTSDNAGDTTQTVTFTGYDIYGQKLSAAVTLNGAATVIATKAFKMITQIAVSAVCTGLISAGFADKFGLPVAVTNVAYVVSVKWDSTLASNAGTFVAADATNPATTVTTDVRGTYVPAGNAANGSRRLVMVIALTALACGPDATRLGALGVTQNLAT